MRRLPHQGARHGIIDHGDASDGVVLLLQGCRGRASTSSSTCGCFPQVERSSSRMNSLLSFLSSLWMASQANISLSLSTNGSASMDLALHHLHAQKMGGEPTREWARRCIIFTLKKRGWQTDTGMGQAGWPGPIGPGPSRTGSVAPSLPWVLLTFCTLPPPIASI
jgi:hypothetical protein